MNRMTRVMCLAFLVSIVPAPVRGQDDKAAQAVLDLKQAKYLHPETEVKLDSWPRVST